MSWRTQGQYRGVGDADQAWLRDFDSKWDTRAEGRCRTDAMDHLSLSFDCLTGAMNGTHGNDQTPFNAALLLKAAANLQDYYRLEKASDGTASRVAIEAELITVAREVARFTIPKQRKEGWSIHVVMKCGARVRARFDDWDSALQAYRSLEELSLWFAAT